MFRNLMNMLRAYREKAKRTKNTDVISPKTIPTLSAKKRWKLSKSSKKKMRTGMTSESSSQTTNNTSTTDSGKSFSSTPESSLPSRCSPGARFPSPCSFSPVPPPDQTEPFPAYEEDETEWDKWNEWNEDIRTVPYKLDHCTQHCMRPICRSVTRSKERRNVDQGACLCSLEPRQPAATDWTAAVQLQQLSEQDLAAVQRAYERTNKHDVITVNLATAITLVDLLRQTYHLQLPSRLQWDPDFTPSVLVHKTQYNAAIQSTNDLIDKLFVHLMLLMPNQTRHIEVHELQRTMHSVMRLEFFWWQATWCFKQQQQERMPKEGDPQVRRMMKDGFVRARRRYIFGKQSVGMQAMMEKLEDVVEMVVGVLVWWSRCTRPWAVENEDAESVGLESSVASFVLALSHFTSDESDADGRNAENE
ncbi:hypothetical protein J3E74DRAFT_445604 [Bipolaris maydis]|nr:hypothetical protein J3E74DRAFT_445604 [Bipolaris maydis]